MSPLRPGLSYLNAFEQSQQPKRRPRRRLSFTQPLEKPTEFDPSKIVTTIRFVGPATDPTVIALQRWSLTQFVSRTLTNLTNRREGLRHAP